MGNWLERLRSGDGDRPLERRRSEQGPTLLEIIRLSEHGVTDREMRRLAFVRWELRSGRITGDVDGGEP